MKHLGDITKIDWFHVPPVDVVTGGSPCQDLSVAGKRAGLAGERSGLYMEQIRCVKELRQADEQRGRTGVAIRPRYMVWENVPGAFSANGGEDFRAVLEEAAKIADETAVIPRPSGKWSNSGAIVGDGWSLAWRVHDAQFWGVPQRRRRISLVCDFAGLSAPEILFERKGLSGDFEPGGTPGEEAAGGTGGGATEAISFQERGGKPGGGKGILIQTERTRALSTLDNQRIFAIGSYASNAWKSPNPNSGVYVTEVAKTLDAINCGYPACNQGGMAVVQAVYDARGNGKTILFEPRSQDGVPRIHGEVSPTLNTAQGGQRQPCVMCIGNGQTNQSIDDKAGALNCMHDQQAVMVLPFDTTQITSPQNGNHPHYGDPCHPLAAQAHVPSIAAVDCRNGTENPNVNGTLQAKEQGQNLNSNNVCRCGAVVRRLTPLECERLQGYPDGWTDIGEWTDSKGKKHKDADSPRYKALGNSIALPFWHWLLRRISAQYVGFPTLGSLFDGIGGFPLCWERCNGKGTALWASEIEEFPMAVTRIRFGGAI